MNTADLLDLVEVQRLSLWPGDTLVLRAPMPLSASQVDRLRQALRAVISEDVKILILDSGMSLEVVEGLSP